MTCIYTVRLPIRSTGTGLANAPAPSFACNFDSARVLARSDRQAVGRCDHRHLPVFGKVEGDVTRCGEPAE